MAILMLHFAILMDQPNCPTPHLNLFKAMIIESAEVKLKNLIDLRKIKQAAQMM